ncbi:MAG: anti-sigma factor [Candidatus Obscuribacterales bacterium]|nr:anti-sigma factor [Steroidobacteraceae bacterium]
MNYRNPQLIDALAAQYALGTLRGAARRRCERLFSEHPALVLAVQRWEERLLDLTRNIPTVQPQAAAWQAIVQRLNFHTNESTRSGFFAWWSGAQLATAAAVAAVAISLAWWTFDGNRITQPMATIADAQQVEVWRIAADKDGERLRVTAAANLQLDPARAYELWALPPPGSAPGTAPISLGLMPKVGEQILSLTATQRAALASATRIAISLEPLGGSPTGTPTGPVLYVANVTSVG